MALNESLNDWLRLTLIPGIGSETQRKLLGAFGLPEAIFSATHSDLRNIIGDRLANALLETDNADLVRAACEWSTGDNQHILTIADHEYPQALLEIADPPTLIYVRGRLDLLNRPAPRFLEKLRRDSPKRIAGDNDVLYRCFIGQLDGAFGSAAKRSSHGQNKRG